MLQEDDDCGVDPSIHDIGPMKEPLPPHTLTSIGWENTLRDPEESRLQLCMKKWPLACTLGFISSRDESKWDEEKTCSADSIHGGALPISMTETIESILKSCRKSESYHEHPVLKQECIYIKNTWSEIEELARENTRTIQQVVAAQVQAYHNGLKEAEKRAKEDVRKRERGEK